MLQLVHIENLENKLSELSSIVDSQHARLSSFPEKVLIWLQQVEDDLKNAQIASVSDIAALRSRLLVVLHRSDIDGRSGVSHRKRTESIASSVLQDAQQVITQAISPKIEQIQEAESVAMRIVSVAQAKGIIEQAKTIQPRQSALMFIQSAMKEDPDTAAAMVHLTGLLGMFDLLIVLDRCITDF